MGVISIVELNKFIGWTVYKLAELGLETALIVEIVKPDTNWLVVIFFLALLYILALRAKRY